MKRGSSVPLNKKSKVRRIGEGFGKNPEQTVYFRSWFTSRLVGPTSYKDCENDQNMEATVFLLNNVQANLYMTFKTADCFMNIDHMIEFYGEENELALPTVFPNDEFYDFLLGNERFVIQCHNVDLQEALLNKDIFKRLNLYIPEKVIREIPLWLEKKPILRIDFSEEQALKL